MELLFLVLLLVVMATALGSGYPVAFALPGSAILTIGLAAACGYMFEGNVDAYFAQGGPRQLLSAGVTNLRGVYWEVERDTLIAIPLFIFMGIMLQRSKIAEDLLVTMAQLFGPVPGGLGISVVFVGALLAATTGIVGATVVAMGMISLPAMLQRNYSHPLATGVIAASGTLGQIIPPSIVLIILADQLGSAVDQASTARKALFKSSTGELSMPSSFDVASTSAGEMFLGAFVPGLVLVGLYMAYILVFAMIKPKSAPAVHFDGKYDVTFARQALLTLVPPLALIFMVLGSIITGIATVNQAGAIGAAGAVVMAGYRLHQGPRHIYTPAVIGILSLLAITLLMATFDLNLKSLKSSTDVFGATLAIIAVIGLAVSLFWSGWRAWKIEGALDGVMIETAKTSSLVFIILLGAAMLTAAFRAFGGEDLVRDFLNSLPGGFWSKFIIVMAVIFILGFFLDFIEIAVVVVPIVAPILLADPSANVTAVWLGVMIGLNIQTSFLTPPFGFALFYLRGVAPAIVKTVSIYKGVIAFIILQLVALGIVGFFPSLVNYLPNRMSLTSESAPPPRNPRLQYCVEQYVAEQFASDGALIGAAITQVASLDLGNLSKSLASEVKGSFAEAEKSMKLLDLVFEKEKIARAAEADYRPLHTEVRQLHRQIRVVDAEAKELKTLLSRLRGDNAAAERQKIEQRMTELGHAKEALEAQVPTTWTGVNKAFKALKKEERTARLKYRRAVDNAYGPVQKLLKTLGGNAAFLDLQGDLQAMAKRVETETEAQLVAPLQTLANKFSAIEGATSVKSKISKARRALKAKTPNRKRALKAMANALKAYDSELAWRRNDLTEVRAEISRYENVIKGSIGIRQQPRLTHDQALFVAACAAGHQDISLSF